VTEDWWLAGSDPDAMLTYVQGRMSDRKLTLFAVACCQRVWHLLDDERSRAAVATLERFADGLAGPDKLAAAAAAAEAVAEAARYSDYTDWMGPSPPPPAAAAAALAARGDVHGAAAAALRAASRLTILVVGLDWHQIQRGRQCDLLRDVVGNPFRPIQPGLWVTPAAVEIAHDCYDRRDFWALPLLADLLEEAGCPEQPVLDHCRHSAEHVRGCWVVDLVLGRL
jgi:hypothetical protein